MDSFPCESRSGGFLVLLSLQQPLKPSVVFSERKDAFGEVAEHDSVHRVAVLPRSHSSGLVLFWHGGPGVAKAKAFSLV